MQEVGLQCSICGSHSLQYGQCDLDDLGAPKVQFFFILVNHSKRYFYEGSARVSWLAFVSFDESACHLLFNTTRKIAIGGKLSATHLKSGVPRVYTRSACDIMRHA
jgi:hypothetical protein